MRGPLDTANPIADRPLGTLVSAVDVSSRYWGPRVGSRAFTRVWEGPGTAVLYDHITLNGTNNCRGYGTSYEDGFRDLGTKFTLDIWLRLEDWAYATGNDEVGIYNFSPGINVGLYGDTQGANEQKLKIGITTSATRGTPDSTVTFAGSATIPDGTALTDIRHIRLVRDGSTATSYVDGVQDGQTTGLVSTAPVTGNFGTAAALTIGASSTSNISFKGKILCAVLRDGAFSSQPIADFPRAPWARNVHHYVISRNIDLGAGQFPHFFDVGRFGVHPRVIYSTGTDYTITSSNFNDAPAPAHVQGFSTWTSRANRTLTTAIVGGVISTEMLS